MCTCDEALALISARLDGSLSGEEPARLEAHLEACPACRDLLADLEELHGALPELWAEPPADLQNRIMDRIRADAAPIPIGKPKRTWKSWLAMAAVFAVIIAGAGGIRWMGLGNLGASSSSGNGAAPAADAAAPAAGLESAALADMDGGGWAESEVDFPSGDVNGGDGAVLTTAPAPAPYSAEQSEEKGAGDSRIADTGMDFEPAAGGEVSLAGGNESPAAMPASPVWTPGALDLIYQQLGGPECYTAEALPGQEETGLLLRRTEHAPADTPVCAVLLCVDEAGGQFHCHTWGETRAAWADAYDIWTVTWQTDGSAELQSERAETCLLCDLPIQPE